MNNELLTENSPTEQLSFQEYADLHYAGDRFRTVYELLYNSGENALSPYIDELTQEEASFVVHLLMTSVTTAYGGEKSFAKALKTATLAETLEVDLDDVHADTPNPFAKNLKQSLLGLLGTIVFSVLAGVMAPHIGIDLSFVGEILMGLCSLTVAHNIISLFRFKNLKKRAEHFHSAAHKDSNPTPPSFEEEYERFRTRHSSEHITYAEGKQRVKDAAKQLAVAFVFLLIYVPTAIFCIEMTLRNGILACLFSCVILLAYPFWQGFMLIKCVLASKAVANLTDADEKAKKKLINRQVLIAVCSVVLILLYAGAAFLSCLECILIL